MNGMALNEMITGELNAMSTHHAVLVNFKPKCDLNK